MESTWLILAGLVLTYVVLSLVVLPLISSQTRYLRSKPWVGPQKEWFAGIKAQWASVTRTRDLMLEGYEKYSRMDELFVLPQLSSDPTVVLPYSVAHEFLSRGDDELNVHALGAETIAAKWTIGDSFRGDTHFDVVRRQLTRKLPLLTEDVYSELVLAMNQQWPATKSDWTTVKIYPTSMRIVSRAANRVFSGEELCRNLDYLEHSRLYAQAVFQSGALLKLIPKALHPILAPIILRPMKKHRNICMEISIPIIKRRLDQMKTMGEKYSPTVDVLQWVLDDALASGLADRQSPDWISRFLLVLNMVAIHTTSIVISNTIMDIFADPNRDDFIAGLREEVGRVVGDGNWSKAAINSLLRVDSCIRETMRYQTLSDFGPRRLVSKSEGITLSNGMHLPKNLQVTVPAHAIHRDEALYEDANRWDGFRFSRPREEYMAQNHTEPDHLEKILEHKNRSLVTTSDDFFSFGFGRHACPGRFFASQEMKLMLAHIVMKYDIEIDGDRPSNLLINGASVPRDAIEMRIRLRN